MGDDESTPTAARRKQQPGASAATATATSAATASKSGSGGHEEREKSRAARNGSRKSSESKKEKKSERKDSSTSSATTTTAKKMPSSSNSESFKYASVIALQEEIKCPVCLRLPRKSPVYQCMSGHILCKECHQRCEDSCPTCRRPLNGKIRSIVADKLLDLMPVQCKNGDSGCDAETHRDHIDAHEAVCEFRLVCCVDIACHARVPIRRMMHHMAEEHEREDFVHANASTYRSHFIVNPDDFTREIMWISDHLDLDGKHFFRECCRTENGNWYVWVYFLGPPHEADNYTTTIKIRQQDDSEELIYKGRVNPLNSEERPELASCNGLVFPDGVARQFTRDRKLYYVVEVERRPPKKTPIKMAVASGSSKKAADKVVEPKKADVEEGEEEVGEEGATKCEGGDGDDVRETSC